MVANVIHFLRGKTSDCSENCNRPEVKLFSKPDAIIWFNNYFFQKYENSFLLKRIILQCSVPILNVKHVYWLHFAKKSRINEWNSLAC